MKFLLFFLLAINLVCAVTAQTAPVDSSKYPKPVTFTAQQASDNMLQQLGIRTG